ncbi:MAG: hypothetical protein S4CHLAM81_12130 [Chlamydiales bacterium]|nr:hypothetical protein [Chlamydiales bacterium]MCH9635989.1 hypothetical protein [Chlamydiales bacterium]
MLQKSITYRAARAEMRRRSLNSGSFAFKDEQRWRPVVAVALAALLLSGAAVGSYFLRSNSIIYLPQIGTPVVIGAVALTVASVTSYRLVSDREISARDRRMLENSSLVDWVSGTEL